VSTAPATREESCLEGFKPDLHLEIGHVLFVDIVGYSRLLINDQHEAVQKLNRIVRSTEAFQVAEKAGRLTRLPSGDGMALVFTNSPEAPVRCAVEASEALRREPKFAVRMGVHSGPVSWTTDVNDHSILAGAGINIAQRVMDCGDGGHILLSKRVAEDLALYQQWLPNLHDLGECEVKHGGVVHIVNLYTANAGKAQTPTKFKRAGATSTRGTAKRRIVVAIVVLGVLLSAALLSRLLADRKTVTPVAAPGAQAPARVTAKSIAVLPFENLSANQETAFFAEGIQDEILTNLAKVADLKVISRTSVMQYKAIPRRNLREIAQQLGVANILEGSVQRSGDRIRVNAQLIDARTDAHLWAQSYDRDLADVFAIQTEIARAIAAQLQAQMSDREKAALAQSDTTDLVAERLFRQAWQLVELASNPDAKESLLEAVSLLEEALAGDPYFLRANEALYTAHVDLYWQGFDHTPERLELARATIEQAAKLHPDAGEVHLLRADYAYKAARDYDRARAELDLARPTVPNNPLTYAYAAAIDRRQGRWVESIRNWEHAVEFDPRNFRYLVETAFTYQAMRRFSDAARMYERALAVKPQDQFARNQLAQLAFLERGELDPWRAQLSSIIGENPKAATDVANGLFDCSLAARSLSGVTRALEAIRAEGLRGTYDNSLWSRDWFVGLAAHVFGNETAAREAFSRARVVEEENVRVQPEYAPAWSRLGLIDAGLGRKEEAIREGRRAVELLPVTKDAVDGPSYIVNLAMIYALVGEKDLAIEQLAVSAQTTGGINYGELKLYPQWDSLRDDPRFEKILSSLAPRVAVSQTVH
jgi:TolB-like protein/class 3 adenylate cyclase/Flp pilus assembly protein TadD